MERVEVGDRIACCDGWGGKVKQVDDRISPAEGFCLIIETEASPGHDAVVPSKHVQAKGDRVIFLDLTLAQLKALCGLSAA